MKIENVYILTNTLKNGGAEKQSVLLASILQKQFITTLIVYYGNQTDEKLINLTTLHNINVLKLQKNHFNKLFTLYKILKKNPNSVIFSYLATTNVINGLVGKLAGVKGLIGGVRSEKIVGFKLFIQKNIHNYFLKYSIFNNYNGKDSLVNQGFSSKKSIVIQNCIEITESEKIKNDFSYGFKIISVGRFVHEKDYITAIDSIEKLKIKINSLGLSINFKYYLIGYGDLESEIIKLISDKKLINTIEVIINPKNIGDYLKDSHLYLSTSIVEGLSNSIMEAMNHSLPIIATNVGDNTYLVKDNFNGNLVDVKNSDYISEILFTYISNPSKSLSMGKNSYALIKNNFNMDLFEEKYLHLINTLND